MGESKIMKVKCSNCGKEYQFNINPMWVVKNPPKKLISAKFGMCDNKIINKKSGKKVRCGSRKWSIISGKSK